MAKNYRNFLIVGTQRTGSSALAEAVGACDEITCGWEWTQRSVPWEQIKLAKLGLNGNFTSLRANHQQYLERTMTNRCQWLGFRRLFRSSDKWVLHPRFAPALLRDRLEGHLKWLSRRPDIYILHIVRIDSIEWLKSKYVSKAAGSYVGRQYPQEMKVVIPIHEATARLQSKEWVDNRLANLKNTNPYLRIYYEDFLAQPEKVTAIAFDFFGVGANSQRQETKISRQSKGSASDYIENHEALQATLIEKNLLKSSLKV